MQGIFRTLHTLHNTFYFKKMKKIVCGEENVAEFNQQLRQHVPAFYALAKDLFASGLLGGLRGATLTITPLDEEEPSDDDRPVEHTCDQCRQWSRDRVGSGEGIGRCAINAMPHKLKWPKQHACRQFEESV